MSSATAEAAFDWVEQLKVEPKKLKLRWLGSGEPAMRWDWVLEQTCTFRARFGMEPKVSVWTNGSVLPERVLVEGRLLGMSFCISLETLRGETTWRGLPTEDVRKNVKRAITFGTQTVKGMITPEHASEYHDVVRDLYELGFTWIQVNPAVDMEWSGWQLEELKESISKAGDYCRRMKKRDKGVTFSTFKRALAKQENGKRSCSSGYSLIGVRADGALVPCHRYAAGGCDLDLGTVFDEPKPEVAQELNQPYICEHPCEGLGSCILFCGWKRKRVCGDASARIPKEWCEVFRHLYKVAKKEKL